MSTDVVLLQDLTGSYRDDLSNMKKQIPIAVNRLTNPYLEEIFGPDIEFGISTFKDKPVSPFGGSSDYVYQSELAFTNDIATVKNEVDSFSASGGADGPEAQLEALTHTAFDSDGGLNYRSGSTRIAVISTDASYHVAGDYATAPANDLDSNIEDEDYPTIAGLKSVLETEDMIPVFLVTDGVEGDYEDLVDQLGRGYVTSLNPDSSNVSDAIKYAVAKSNLGAALEEGTTSSDELNGDGSNDIIFGLDGEDQIFGYGGNDFLDGGFDLDYLYGGAGSDTVSGGDGADYVEGNNGPDTLIGGSGNDTLIAGVGNDVLQGDDGDDILDGGLDPTFSDSDTYVFDTGAEYGVLELGVDQISFFKPNDKIQLSQDTFTAVDPSNFFGEASTVSEAKTLDEAIVNVGGQLYYNENGVDPGFGSGGQFASVSFSFLPLNSSNFDIVDTD
ncbi:MAG: hypothetical protein F6K39_19675 [Okeania sp. SIO3B3]|nr:hypothetical protein [Okeania sp. SIO3B3]